MRKGYFHHRDTAQQAAPQSKAAHDHVHEHINDHDQVHAEKKLRQHISPPALNRPYHNSWTLLVNVDALVHVIVVGCCHKFNVRNL